MKMEEAIRILKNNGHKYTDKRRDMIEMFIKEDKYINAKTVQQQM
ncbi:TPA: transcriptional repressor, partial [Staphylococcus pseudintermedius]